jgi:exopolysaccharide biosynthesis polyprenyl glycosylphosphotransferase
MSTSETVASSETKLLTFAPPAARSQAAYSRILAWSPLHKLTYLCSDLFAVTLAHMLAVRLIGHFLHLPLSAMNPFEYHRFYIPFFAVVLYLFEGYKSPELRRPEQELEKSCKALAVSFLGLVLFNFVVLRSESFSRYLLLTWFVLASVLLVSLRFTLRAIYEKLWRAGFCQRRALLIGAPAGLEGYQRSLSIQRHRACDVVGYISDSEDAETFPAGKHHHPWRVSLKDVERSLANAGAQLLIIVPDGIPGGETWLKELVGRCKQLRVDVELYSEVLATANLNYEHDDFSGCFRFYAAPEWSLTVQRAVKRGLDLAIGLVGGAVTLLLTPFMYALVNLEDRGPVFYRREFVGCDGQIHYYLKFRTMLKDADEILRRDPKMKAEFIHQYKLKRDPRMLRVGRFMRRYSLDEFPQFFSLLSGKLAFVGPRVISEEEKQRYGTLLPKLLSCRPGMSGFWQVMGRQTTTYEERVEMDMFYVDRWSIWLDLVIIAKTFWIVLKAEGAY